jgi:hypothetical protein
MIIQEDTAFFSTPLALKREPLKGFKNNSNNNNFISNDYDEVRLFVIYVMCDLTTKEKDNC